MLEELSVDIPEAFAFLFEPKRYKVPYGGRGSGKSHNIGKFLLTEGYKRKIGVLCARELQVSIGDSVHRLLEQLISENKYWSRFYKVTQKEIVGVNGTFFVFKGLKHNASEIKSFEGVDYCWVEEGQAVSDKSWEILIPTIRKPNSEIIVSFNPKNPTDPTYQRFVVDADEDMLVKKISWRDNPFFPEVLEKERLKLERIDPEAYEHVWEGQFDTRYSGAVYAKHVKQDQITDIGYDPNRPIFTAWDLGYDDATAIVFFQLGRNEIVIFDYYEANFEDIKHYCEMLYGAEIIIDERDPKTGRVLRWHHGERLSEERSEYDYRGAIHYVPHDAAYKLQAAGGRSIVEQALEFGISLSVMPATTQQNSEAALRKALGQCWFRKDSTKDLVQALMSYHYEYDEDRKIYAKEPVHDWSSHACDALECMARAWRDQGTTMTDVKRDIVHASFKKARALVGGSPDPYRVKKRTSDKRYQGRKR